MKRKMVAVALVCALVLSGCGSSKRELKRDKVIFSAKAAWRNQEEASDSKKSAVEVGTEQTEKKERQKNADISDVENRQGTYMQIAGSLMLHVPSDWVYLSEDSGYYKDGKVQFMMWIYDDYDKKKLKELKDAFGYRNEKEALREFVQLGADVSPERIEKDTGKELCLPGYRLYLTGDKWYPGERKETSFMAQAMIDRKEKKLYMLYFFDEMADEERVDAFLEGITLFDKKEFYDETDGLFRWQGGAEKYPK